MTSFYRWQDKQLTLFCHLQPKASKDEFCGAHGDRLKVRITAPPIDGKANTHLIRFIAKQFGVTKADVVISSGKLGRQKTLQISQPHNHPGVINIEKA
jgi:uncharacterized protein (TIGR00251 family)